MTFDDGPGLALDKYLDAFKNQKVQVTFHFNPPVISSFRSGVNVVKRAVEEGHIIGLRFNPAMNAMQMSNTELAKELAAQSETIQKVTGKYPKYVRFSYQQYDDRVVNIASVMGFTVTSHSIDSGDYRFANFSGAPGGEIHKVYYDQLEQNKGGSFIALHHDLNAAAAAITEDLIANVKARGFKIINMQECLGDSAAYRGNCPIQFFYSVNLD
ncbi:hypothetical protein BKA69DRAFT_1094689 [Paraphysoderma sedebokerense]|nr:hypothetical protein BKA69DRAFT_1094689 [Paraphysoderma sedebokerense]